MGWLDGPISAVLASAATLVGAVASVAQVTDYLTSGKLRLVLFSVTIVLTALLVVFLIALWRRARKRAAALPEQQRKKQRPVRLVITLSLIFTSLAGLVILGTAAAAIVGTPSSRGPLSAPPSSSTVSTTPMTTLPPTTTTSQAPLPPPQASFTAPAPNTAITAGASVLVSGHASELGQHTLWLVTKPDAGGGSYYLTDNSPVTTRDGDWSFPDTGVGDASDRGHNITYLVLLADQACASMLANAGDTIDALPQGCTILATTPIHVR